MAAISNLTWACTTLVMVERHRFTVALSIALAISVGCASHVAPTKKADSDTPLSSERPRIVTDLSQVSPADTVVKLPPSQSLANSPSVVMGDKPNATVQSNIDRFFVSTAPKLRYSEEPTPPPGDIRLLNAKANQFAGFGYDLLRQTIAVAQKLEPDKFEQRKLPNELKPVVLIAVMDQGGRLKEIAIEQHSGDSRVDRVVIEACKQGLWSRNPPAGAIASDGNFRLRIQGRFNNYSIDREGKYTYDTHFGLAIL
jgi:hypothetical protein